MNSGNDNWHSSGGPPSHPGMDQMNQQPRPLGSFRYALACIASVDQRLIDGFGPIVRTRLNKVRRRNPPALFSLPQLVSLPAPYLLFHNSLED
jgi:hypothetical protein